MYIGSVCSFKVVWFLTISPLFLWWMENLYIDYRVYSVCNGGSCGSISKLLTIWATNKLHDVWSQLFRVLSVSSYTISKGVFMVRNQSIYLAMRQMIFYGLGTLLCFSSLVMYVFRLHTPKNFFWLKIQKYYSNYTWLFIKVSEWNLAKCKNKHTILYVQTIEKGENIYIKHKND